MKKDNIKLVLFWISSFLVIIFMMAFTSHAALPQQSKLPFLVDTENWVNADGYTLSQLQDFYDARWGSAYPRDFTSMDDVIVYESVETISGVTYNFTTVWFPNASNYTYVISLNTSYNDFDTDLNVATVKFRGYSYVSFSEYRNRYNDPSFTLSAPLTNVTFFYNSNKEITYISNAFYYLASSIDGANDYPVFAIAQPVFPSGHATPPDLTSDDLSVDDSVLDLPTWETPSNPPTFDSSNIPKSTYDLIEWGIVDPNGIFHILKNNIQNGFQWLVNVISGYGQAIINNIQNSIQNLYDNFVSLFEPISENITGIRDDINYIKQPLSADIIWDNISGTSLITNYTTIMNAVADFKTSFENLSEPSEFKIPIHLENISMFGTLTTQYIDLGIINPVKSIIRTFMWALITYSLVVTIIDSIANYINGGGDES